MKAYDICFCEEFFDVSFNDITWQGLLVAMGCGNNFHAETMGYTVVSPSAVIATVASFCSIEIFSTSFSISFFTFEYVSFGAFEIGISSFLYSAVLGETIYVTPGNPPG